MDGTSEAVQARLLLAESLRKLDRRLRVVEAGLLSVGGYAVSCDVIAGYRRLVGHGDADRPALQMAPAGDSDHPHWVVDADGPAQVVVQFSSAGLEPPMEIHAAAGVEQFAACVDCGGSYVLRVWDRMGWTFEERDVVELPCPCEPLEAEWHVTSPGAGQRPALGIRRGSGPF